MRCRQNKSGFTIVELLIVIVVIGILAAITIVAYNGVQARARDAERLSEIKRVQTSLEVYLIDNGEYPTCAGSNFCASEGSYTAISLLPAMPPMKNDPRNLLHEYGYYYARGSKKTGPNTYISTGKPTDYIIGTRLEAASASTWSSWYNTQLNYMVGN